MTLAQRLRAALLDRAIADGAIITGDPAHPDQPGQTVADEAAVLVAVTDAPEPAVILTRRSPQMRRHAGQVAFPGGRIDPEDADAVAAALREAHEEVGLDPALVEVVGIGDRYRTVTGFCVTPVVGVVPPGIVLVPHEAEVAAVFEVPLAYLLDPANHVRGSVMVEGHERHFIEIRYGGERIWGATAGMIVNLSRRLAPR
jgi:8-oxo-dGTP pyrophosphatase MutT (NUDIX family)